ncbi:MAG: phosphate/phosphite/phosphonate ABC transporter substrate-binding protein [Deltaproteobacteria bacterium]|nr:phosphate/phosphite/phosphonate ABC transporter substrate-binding protein [Deltaproteobacteria bacterium]
MRLAGRSMLGWVLLGLLCCCPLSADEQPEAITSQTNELVFGMNPVIGVEATHERFTRLTKHLSTLLGVKVILKVTHSYGELIDEMAAGRIDLAKFSPLAYVRADRRIEGLNLIASHVANGSITYSSYLVALQETPFSSLKDLKGSRICFADLNSTSGYLYPLAFLLEYGIVPEEHFHSVTFAGSHKACLEGLFSGRFDLAATFAGAIRDARQSGLHVGELIILAKTGRIPYDAYCVRGNLNPLLQKKIQKALLEINTLSREGRSVLGPTLGINGWVKGDDSVYDGIRHVEAQVKKSKCAE